MKKNAIALAVGALCIAPAAQAQIVFGNDTIGTVQFYGKLYPQVTSGTSSGATAATDTVSTLAKKPTGTTAGSGLSVDSNNSRLGFRGERNLGATGLKGIWQIEQAIHFDDKSDTSTFATRNSFLGLAGGFGTVKLGQMDTIYKEYGAVVGILGLSSGNFVSSSEVLSKNAANPSGASSFHVRQPNSIQYQSPELSGFQVGAQFSPDEKKGDPAEAINKQLWSFGVKYEAGPLYVSLQDEIHKDFFGGDSASLPKGTHSRDNGLRLSATYKLGKHKLAADIAQIRYSDSGAAAGGLDEYKRVSWDIGWEAKWGGPWRTSLSYTQAQAGSCTLVGGAACSTDGLKGQQLAGGVAYDLDKQTFLYVIAAKLINGKSAIFDNFNRSVSAGRGADITQVALGMAYKF